MYLAYLSLLWWLWYTCILSYHHQIGYINHFPSFRARPWNSSIHSMVQCVFTFQIQFLLMNLFSSYDRWHDGPWASCQTRKIASAHVPGMPGTFSPPPEASDPNMHHGTCVTHVPWCMPGSLTSGFLWSRRRGKTFPAFLAHAQPAMLRIWLEAHGEMRHAQELVTFSVDFKLTNHQKSTISNDQKIDVTSICGAAFMACNVDRFSTCNGTSRMCVKYFLFWKISWRHGTWYAKANHKLIKEITIWKTYKKRQVRNLIIGLSCDISKDCKIY